MYNEEIKKRFLEERYGGERGRGSDAYINTFKRFAPLEEKRGADLCTWSTEEVQDVIDGLSSTRIGSLVPRIFMLKAYSQWCVETGAIAGATTNTNGLVIPDNIDVIRNTMVTSPVDLQNYLDVLFTEENFEGVDVIYRGFFWLAFAGLNSRDAVEVSSDEVVPREMLIKHGGRSYEIYKEGLLALKECSTLTSFNSIHKTGAVIVRDRKPGKSILRNTNGKASTRVLMARVSSIREETKQMIEASGGEFDKQLSYDTVRLSGIFYRIHRAEVELDTDDVELLPFDEAAEMMCDTSVRFDPKGKPNLSITRRKYQIKRALIRDYKQWKRLLD